MGAVSIEDHFALPTYTVDLDPQLVLPDNSYIVDNIKTVEVGEFTSPFQDTTWKHYHNIPPNDIPNICESIVNHANEYAQLIGVTLQNQFTFWINQFYGSTRECSNDRHSHADNKIIGVYYAYNNEPHTANLVIENPIVDTVLLSPYKSSGYNSGYFKRTVSIHSPEGRLIFFPGFVWHWAHFTNNIDAKRISLALEIN